jgi:hypothetical protein
MRQPDPFYALGKFGEAVFALATEPGDVRARLYSAFICLLPVQIDDLPSELRQDLEWVTELLTRRQSRYPPSSPGFEGDVLATLRSMRNVTGVKIAKRILEIESRLRGALYTERRRGPRAVARYWSEWRRAHRLLTRTGAIDSCRRGSR